MRPSRAGPGVVAIRRTAIAVVAALVSLGGGHPDAARAAGTPSSATDGAASTTATVAARPVPGPVVRGFHRPTRYGPGHRGVDLRAVPGTRVAAPVSGTVVFAGRVVDATWVTVDDGRHRWTVGPLATLAVGRGAAVVAGAALGTSDRAHGATAVHLSARRGDRYVEPLLVARPRVSLVPLRGGRAVAPPPDAVAAGAAVAAASPHPRAVR